MSRFTGRDLGRRGPAGELYADFGELRSVRAGLDRLIENWAARLEESWLAQDLTYTSRIDGRTRTLPAWLLVAHMFNHQPITAASLLLGKDPLH